jgi:hypothetical protein
MIKAILSSIVYTIFIAALTIPLAAFLGLIDFNSFDPFISLAAQLVEPFISQFDLLLTTFPFMLGFILYFSVLGIIRLVVVQFEKR